MAEIIRTENLQYAYPADEGAEPVLALKGVDLTIEQGSFVVVLGHNGSGKSTLAKTLNGVLLPCGGQCVCGGNGHRWTNICCWPSAGRWAWCSRTRTTRSWPTWWRRTWPSPRRTWGFPAREIRQRVDDALAAVGMGEFARHAPHLLSGGQKQRIAIAGVLAMEPECIVLDEATAMLDPVGRREVLSAVHRLNREKGITVVLITHHMNEAEDADRVVVMDDGKVIMDGAPREVFTQVERLRSMGLTVPDTVDLLDRLRKDGLDVPLTALTVEECADAILAAVSK